MVVKDIKSVYKDIFKSYYNVSLEEHIKKIIELDAYLPYSSTFFCITNTQTCLLNTLVKICRLV